MGDHVVFTGFILSTSVGARQGSGGGGERLIARLITARSLMDFWKEGEASRDSADEELEKRGSSLMDEGVSGL